MITAQKSEHTEAINKLLSGICPDCGEIMPPVAMAQLDDTGGEIGGLMCESCFIQFMTGEGWDLECYERFTPGYVTTPAKRAYVQALAEQHSECIKRRDMRNSGKISTEQMQAAQAEIKEAYQPLLQANPFRLLACG